MRSSARTFVVRSLVPGALMVVVAVLVSACGGGGAASMDDEAVTSGSWAEATAAMADGRFDEAARYFEQRVELGPDRFLISYNLGLALHGAGRYSEALQAHFVAAAYSQNRGAALFNAARTFAQMGDGERALRWLDLAVASGFDDQDGARNESDLAALHDDPRFVRILATIPVVGGRGMPADHPAYRSPWHASSERIEVRTLGGPIPGRTGGLALAPNGDLVAGDFASTVHRVSPEGARETLLVDVEGASGNVFDREGNLYQAHFSGNTLTVTTPGGETRTLIGEGLAGPVGVVFDSAGALYAANCDGQFISKWTPGGENERFSSGPLYYCPNALAVDDEDNLYVANFHDGVIVKVTPDGEATFLANIPGGGASYIVYLDGVLYVNGNKSLRVYRLTLDGELSVIAGTGERGGTDGPARQATFAKPNGLAVSPTGACLYVNDNRGDWRDGANEEGLLQESTIRVIHLDPDRACQ